MKTNSRCLQLARVLLHPELLVAALILMVSSFVFYLSREYPEVEITEGAGPAFYPRLLAGVWVILGIINALGSIRMREERRLFKIPAPRRFLMLVITMISYPYLLGIFGFHIASFFFLLLLILELRPKEKIKTINTRMYLVIISILISIVVTIFIYALFWWGAKVQLPMGNLFN